jgi:hypothetical protein
VGGHFPSEEAAAKLIWLVVRNQRAGAPEKSAYWATQIGPMRVRSNADQVALVESSWPVILWFGSLVMEESQHFDRSALQALVAAAWEEFDGEILLLVRDGSKVRLGASENGGLNARVILSECLRRLNQLEEQPLDTTTRAFVRVVSEELKNDQVVLLIVRGQGDIRLASGPGAYGKVRDMLDDALQSIGGERRRR